MKKLTLAMLITLDGFIEGEKGDLSWFLPPEEFFDLYGVDFMGRFDTMVLGGKSFQMFAGYWPKSNDPTAPLINSLKKVGIGKTVKEADWNNSTVARVDLAQTINDLKRQPGKGIVCFGGAKLASSLLRLDLVDELMLTVCPTVLGKGTPFFDGTSDRKNMRLLETKRFKSGGVLLKYEPARA